MSCFNLAIKKLLPAKKAWKSFTYKLKSRVNKLNNSKPIKKVTRRLMNFRSMIKTRALLRNKLPPTTTIFSHHHQQHQIYVDELYSSETIKSLHAKKTVVHAAKGETSMARSARETKNAVKNDHDIRKKGKGKLQASVGGDDDQKSMLYSVDDAWKAVVASSPQLMRGVDERADDFIYKFREDMKLQKERSMLEFQEMLARSA